MHGMCGGMMRSRSTIVGALLALVLVVVTFAAISCDGESAETSLSSTTSSAAETTSSLSTSTTVVAGAGDWPYYHHDEARSGWSSDQEPLGQVQQAWTSPELDGELIYAQPLVVGDRVLVATEGNSVVALDATSGAIVWQTNLGAPVAGNTLPCGNIDPSGITGTPVIDTESGTVFVVAFLSDGPHHELFALDLETGTVQWSRTVDPPGLSPVVEQERGALTLTGGRIYVPFGGLGGDCGMYKGAVMAVPVDGTGPVLSYVVPTKRMGGIWNPTGLVVDQGGDLWLATGNTASQAEFDYGNAVIRLSPELEVMDYFAPEDWAYLNAGDYDLNTIGPVLLSGGRVLAVGKTGSAYVLDAADLGHVSTALTTMKVAQWPFGTAVAMDSRVFVPSDEGLVAVDVSDEQLSIAWSVPVGAGSPIIAAGHVWALGRDGTVMAVDPADGSVVFSLQITAPPSRFNTLSAANGRLFVADGTKIVAISLR